MNVKSRKAIAYLLVSTGMFAIYFIASRKGVDKAAEANQDALCKTYQYRYKSQGVIDGLGSASTPLRQEWTISLTSLGNDPKKTEDLQTRVFLGNESSATYYVIHNAKGEIQSLHKKSDIKDAVALTNYPMLNRLPLLRPDLLDIDRYETRIQDQSFVVTGELRQTKEGWTWQGQDLKSTLPSTANLSLSNMTISYLGFIGPAGFEKIEGVQGLAYELTQQTIKANEQFSFEKIGEIPSSDCQNVDVSTLEDYAEISLERMTEAVAQESQREYFEKNFDVNAKLSEAIALSRTHIPGEPSSNELLKSISNLSQYYRHFPNRQKEIFEKLEDLLSNQKANPGERLFLTDLAISFGNDESAEKIFQLLSDHKFPDEQLENRVIASFNHVEKPSLDMYRYFLSEYKNDTNPIDTRTTSLLAAASISGHFESESRDTIRMLTSKLQDKNSSSDEKNLAVTALGNIGVEDSLNALYSNAFSKDREIAEEAIWGIAKSERVLAEKLLGDIIKAESMEEFKRISAALGLVRRTVPNPDEDNYRQRLDTLYMDLVDKPKQSDKVMSALWNGMLGRGYLTSPSQRQEHNRLLVEGIKSRRDLHVWERAKLK